MLSNSLCFLHYVSLAFEFPNFELSTESTVGMSLVSYFLAKNPDVQEQVFLEVTDAIQQNGGNEHLDYNAIQSLPYLDQVIMFTSYLTLIIVLELQRCAFYLQHTSRQ